MARRFTNAESQLIGWLAVIGLPLYGIYSFGEAVGWMWFAAAALLIAGGWIWYQSAQKTARRTYLHNKYGDEAIVAAIMRHSKWQGQTPEQLRESVGEPADVDEKVLKTKTKEVWKYHRRGTNRFALRVNLEDGRVVGWDEKI